VLQPDSQIWYCFVKNIWLTAAAQKLDPGQHNIFGLVELPLKKRNETFKLGTYECHSAAGDNIL